MEKIILNAENGIEITSDISPRDFDKVTILYKKYRANEVWDIVVTMDSIKLMLIDKSKIQYIDDMLDAKEGVLDIYEVLDDWAEKTLDVILKMNDRKKKSKA